MYLASGGEYALRALLLKGRCEYGLAPHLAPSTEGGLLLRRNLLLLATVLLGGLLASGAALAETTPATTAGTDQGALSGADGWDVALDRVLKELVDMPGGPPGVIAVVQRGENREVHTFGVANPRTDRDRKSVV